MIWAGHREVSLSPTTWSPMDLSHRKLVSQKAWVQLPNAKGGAGEGRCRAASAFSSVEGAPSSPGHGRSQGVLQTTFLHLFSDSACASGGYCILVKVMVWR